MNGKIYSWVSGHYKLVMPYLLTVILGLSTYAVYNVPLFSGWTAGVILMTTFVFALCEFVNKHHFVGGVILTVVIFAALRIFAGLTWGYDYGQTFQKWFLTGSDQVETKFEYLLALLVSLVPFIGVVVYYFSIVLYRMSFLTLASMIPCALYVKVLSDIDNVYICLIALLNVVIFMINSRSQMAQNKRSIGMEAGVISACVFTFVLLIVSSLIPKKNDAIYYDRFEALFMDSGFTIELDESYSFLSEFSGGPDSFRNFTNRRMYSVFSPELMYLKRQNFDYYDFENDCWYPDKYYGEPYYTDFEWRQKASLMSLESLRDAMNKAEGYSGGFLAKYGLERAAGFENFKDELRQAYIQPEDFSAVYYITAARQVGITSYQKRNAEQIYVTRGGLFRNKLNRHDPASAYQIDYYSELTPRFMWEELGGCDFDNRSSGRMLEEMKDILSANGDDLAEIPMTFLEELEYAEKYAEDMEENNSHISDRIRSLAMEIVGDAEYDWQKADRLQNYFILNNFIYDLDYIAADNSPEYFLFESKRGSCSDYASAFVLMARSVGLTVRYAEGYAPDISTTENLYIIRDSCSHAYPEVFIQNIGWLTFEPTVPSQYNNIVDDEGGVQRGLDIDYDLVYAMCVVTGIMLAVVLAAIILYPYISERIFVRNALSAAPSVCAVMIYRRLCDVHLSGIIKRAKTYTPEELSEECRKVTGHDLGTIVIAVEITVYGGENITASSEALISEYDMIKAQIKEYKKNRNKFGRMNRNAK